MQNQDAEKKSLSGASAFVLSCFGYFEISDYHNELR